jgi:diguanylate cyclase (GGDEF)-like protein
MGVPANTTRASWLCPDVASRQRMLDMDDRIKRPRAIAFAVLGLAIAATIAEQGWWPAALLAAAILGFGLMGSLRQRVAAPEYPVFASWAFAQLLIAAAIAMTGGVHSYAMSWLLVPIVTLPARFGVRGVMTGIGFTAALLVAIGIAVEPAQPASQVYGTIYALAGLVAAGILSLALMQSDAEHRTESVMDGLTGMLNRRALERRLEELEAQADLVGVPVAIVAADLDHFKRVNDEHGHLAGDAVLVDAAYRLRKELRAYDLAYRVGGEEFVVVLPGATVDEAAEIAERLRAAVSAEPSNGIAVTMSFGVAGSDAGGAFAPTEVLEAADRALYAAKAAGRNQVACAERPRAHA